MEFGKFMNVVHTYSYSVRIICRMSKYTPVMSFCFTKETPSLIVHLFARVGNLYNHDLVANKPTVVHL